MATGNSTLIVNGLLMYVTSYISHDSIQNVVHDTYDDDTVTLAKMYYGNITVILLTLEKILQEGQSTGMLKILLTVSVRLTNTSDKTQLPVIFVASDMRNLPEDEAPNFLRETVLRVASRF